MGLSQQTEMLQLTGSHHRGHERERWRLPRPFALILLRAGSLDRDRLLPRLRDRDRLECARELDMERVRRFFERGLDPDCDFVVAPFGAGLFASCCCSPLGLAGDLEARLVCLGDDLGDALGDDLGGDLGGDLDALLADGRELPRWSVQSGRSSPDRDGLRRVPRRDFASGRALLRFRREREPRRDLWCVLPRRERDLEREVRLPRGTARRLRGRRDRSRGAPRRFDRGLERDFPRRARPRRRVREGLPRSFECEALPARATRWLLRLREALLRGFARAVVSTWVLGSDLPGFLPRDPLGRRRFLLLGVSFDVAPTSAAVAATLAACTRSRSSRGLREPAASTSAAGCFEDSVESVSEE